MMPSKGQLVFKRFFDIALSGSALLLLSPLLLSVAIFIKFRSPGPIFFRHLRIGLNGSEFYLLKFRSMSANASSLPNISTTRLSDPRIFRGGKTIRKYKFDELPQLINVLIGDMSLIGPRPTVIEDFNRMTCEQRRRVSIRPGLSGLAQISGNTSLNWPMRIALDLQYIEKLSVWTDIKIIIITIGLIFTGRADTHPVNNDEWS
jgi:undecaprenyl phosphate N,N'-diacetylbacillosamine 1-phosphate transferase